MSRDFRDLLSEFNAQSVEYLIVGAHALAAHGHVRATKDLDIWVRPTSDNASRVLKALTVFGAPLRDLSVDDLTSPGVVFQIGLEPLRIDILTSISGVEFEDAWNNRLSALLFGETVSALSRQDLIRNKRAAGRLQDLADVERLESNHPPNGTDSNRPSTQR